MYADTVDISDTSYAAVLVDDLDGDGRLELLVSTMSGHLYSIGTPALDHPLKTWPQQIPGTSNFVARHAQVLAIRNHLFCTQPPPLSMPRGAVGGEIVAFCSHPPALSDAVLSCAVQSGCLCTCRVQSF